jgi:hypothetical protein
MGMESISGPFKESEWSSNVIGRPKDYFGIPFLSVLILVTGDPLIGFCRGSLRLASWFGWTLLLSMGAGFSAELIFDDVDRVHPDYELSVLHTETFRPQVSDLDWLPDGRLAMVLIHPKGQNITGIPARISELWVIPKPDSSFHRKEPVFIDSLTECVGVEVVDGKIYVAEKTKLMEYTLSSSDAVVSLRKIADIPHDKDGYVNFQEHPFGLMYRGGFFYTANAGAVAKGGGSFEAHPDTLKDPYSGGVLKINAANGAVELLNGGLRGCNGLAWGPDSSIWVTDNQGSWLPSSKLIAIEAGRNYGYFNGPNGFADVPESWPAVWLPHGDIARSPTHPAFLSKGRYKGQFLIGDLSQGGIKRAFVEKVANEWQGAAFSFSGGFYGGVQKLLVGPQDEIVIGELGQGDYQNWGWRGITYGLEVLRPKPQAKAFEILAIRSRRQGMEMEFTEPLGPEFESKDCWKWKMTQMKPNAEYGGGNMVDLQYLTILFTQISEDRRSLYFELEGLTPMRVLEVAARDTIRSASGQVLRCPASWYTLKNINPVEPFSNSSPVRLPSQTSLPRLKWVDRNHMRIQFEGAWQLRLYSTQGRLLQSVSGNGNALIARPRLAEESVVLGKWSSHTASNASNTFLWAPASIGF